jgi:hypothetical protein
VRVANPQPVIRPVRAWLSTRYRVEEYGAAWKYFMKVSTYKHLYEMEI